MPSYIAFDRGKKHIGRSYAKDDNIVLLGGYIDNSQLVYPTISQLILTHRIDTIVVGRARLPRHLQASYDSFGKNLALLFPDMPLHFQDESYSSVQARDRLGDFTKSYRDDVVSAMIILERFLAS